MWVLPKLVANPFPPWQIPFMVLLALAALGVGAYGVANFHAPKFGTVLFIYSLTLWAFENMAQTMITLFRNQLIGMLLFVCAWCVTVCARSVSRITGSVCACAEIGRLSVCECGRVSGLV